MNVYGLIGYPLGHSFSKKFFTEKFEKENLAECSFELYSLENIAAFPKLIAKEKNLSGLAVTIPYKESVIKYLDSLDDEAKKIGAVNCIRITNKILKGYNTDFIGFEKSFVPLLQSNHIKALVLGSGGSSKAVQYVLQKLNIPFLIVTRNHKLSDNSINYDMIDRKMMNAYSIIINCTPVGMAPSENVRPLIPYEFLNKNNYLYDLIYSPAQTIFLKEGFKTGATIKNGYEMLILQAEENWRIWNDL